MDEEMVIEGSELHKYLLDQGFTDFEVVNRAPSSASTSKTYSGNTEMEDLEITLDTMLNELCCHQVETILSSMLLFAEDVEQVEEFRSKWTTVTDKCSKPWSTELLSCLAIVGWNTILANKLPKKMLLLSIFCTLTGVTVFTGNYLWRSHRRNSMEKQLSEHISSLQHVSSIAQKLFRSLRETEIISTGKLLPGSVYGTAYIGSRLWESDPKSLPTWKTLPELRKVLCEELLNLAVILSSATETIKNLLPSLKLKRMVGPQVCSGRVSVLQVIAMNVNIEQECITLADVYKLDETYLLTQSDYLKHLSWCFCPAFWASKTGDHLPAVYGKVIKATEKSLQYSFNQLSLQYKIFLGVPVTKIALATTNTPLEPEPSISISNEINNISLQLYSLIYQMKEFQDNLDEMEENVLFLHVHQNHGEMLSNVESVFEEIKLSLNKTYQISRKALNMKNTNESNEVPEITTKTETDPNIRKTYVQVGASDYEIKSDEVDVFLGLSQDENDKVVEKEQQYYDDIVPTPRNQKLCRHLVKELKLTIEKRKKEYDEKEKLSLEKQGLVDLDPSNLVESAESDTDDLSESPNKHYGQQHHCIGYSSFLQDSSNGAELSESSTSTIQQSDENTSNMSTGTVQQSDERISNMSTGTVQQCDEILSTSHINVSPVDHNTTTSYNHPRVQFNPFPKGFLNDTQVSNEAVSVSRSWMATGVEEEFVSEVSDSEG